MEIRTTLLPQEVRTEPDRMFHHRCERCGVTCRNIAQGCAWGHPGAVPSDNAASSPHQSDGAVVEGPAELFGRLSQQHETLRVGNDLGCIKSLQTNEQSALTSELRPATGDLKFIFKCFTFLMSSRNAALSPLNLTPCGPERLRLASTRSSLSEDRHLAKTASPETKRQRRGRQEKGDTQKEK